MCESYCPVLKHAATVCVSLLSALPRLAQVKDKWDFRMTARYEMYADLFSRYVQPDFKQQIVRDPSLAAAAQQRN